MFVLSQIVSRSTGAMRVATVSVGQRVARLSRAIANRMAVRELAQLDDHALKDIGLTRSDVQGALGVSWTDDPSRVLGSIAGTSHGHARLQAGALAQATGSVAQAAPPARGVASQGQPQPC